MYLFAKPLNMTRCTGQFSTLPPSRYRDPITSSGAGIDGREHRGQELRIVRQIGVHLAHDIGVGCNRDAKAVQVGAPQPARPGTVHDLHAPDARARGCRRRRPYRRETHRR